MTTPLRVAVTGAAGQIGYALIFRIASGEVFGPNQPVILHLVEVPPVLAALNGVQMELDDCAFPTLAGVVINLFAISCSSGPVTMSIGRPILAASALSWGSFMASSKARRNAATRSAGTPGARAKACATAVSDE